MFYTANKETGMFIDKFETVTEALNAIRQYETDDKAEGLYEPDWYDVVDERHCSVM